MERLLEVLRKANHVDLHIEAGYVTTTITEINLDDVAVLEDYSEVVLGNSESEIRIDFSYTHELMEVNHSLVYKFKQSESAKTFARVIVYYKED